jgi:hypothetical protein
LTSVSDLRFELNNASGILPPQMIARPDTL